MLQWFITTTFFCALQVRKGTILLLAATTARQQVGIALQCQSPPLTRLTPLCAVILLVFDVTSKESLAQLQEWHGRAESRYCGR